MSHEPSLLHEPEPPVERDRGRVVRVDRQHDLLHADLARPAERLGHQRAADPLAAPVGRDGDAERRDVTRDGMRFTLDVDVADDAVAVERHDLRLAVGPRTSEPRTIHARRRARPLRCGRTRPPRRSPSRTPGTTGRPAGAAGRSVMPAGGAASRHRRGAPEPRAGRGRPASSRRTHTAARPSRDRDHRRTTDPVVRAGERVGVRARRGERQQVAALDVGRERDRRRRARRRTRSGVRRWSRSRRSGRAGRDASATVYRASYSIGRMLSDIPPSTATTVRPSPSVRRSPTRYSVTPALPDDAATGLRRQRRHREAVLAAGDPQAALARRRPCP